MQKIDEMVPLYNYSLQKSENFHKKVDNKKNILLICQTEEDMVIGAFSSAGFSIRPESKETQAFLFTLNQDSKKMKTYRLKKDKASIIYDCDYIVFGQEELCIEKGTNELTTYLVKGEEKEHHYECPVEDRYVILSTVSGTDSVKLKNYELIEL